MTHSVLTGASLLGADQVEGPLKGYHHYAFAVRVDPASPLAGSFPWLKLREPRAGALWHDMRRFAAEDQLLRDLHGRVPRVPAVSSYQVGEDRLHFAAFIEGVTLDRLPEPAGRVAERFMDQIEELFAALAAVDVRSLGQDDLSDCGYPGLPGDTRSTAFARKMVHFSAEHAYGAHRAPMEDLLAELGAERSAWSEFEKTVPEMADRDPRLLHADLHRKNFIVDRKGGLWTIDWELALFGDPLYDLATHLHLMRYRPDQERDLIGRWKRAVGPLASRGADDDLPHYLRYKRLQSVFTDIVRGAARVQESPGAERVRHSAGIVRSALIAAREIVGLEAAPALPAVESALRGWCERRS